MLHAETDRLCALQPFFDAMHRAVRPGGMVCTQVHLSIHVTAGFGVLCRHTPVDHSALEHPLLDGS